MNGENVKYSKNKPQLKRMNNKNEHRNLPKTQRREGGRERAKEALVFVSVGGVLTDICLNFSFAPSFSPLPSFFFVVVVMVFFSPSLLLSLPLVLVVELWLVT